MLGVSSARTVGSRGVRRVLQDLDLDLLHLEHRLHGTLSTIGVGVAQQLTHPLGDDLPAQTEPILEPSALALFATLGELGQKRSTSSWSLQLTLNETASVNGNCGPPLMAMNS